VSRVNLSTKISLANFNFVSPTTVASSSYTWYHDGEATGIQIREHHTYRPFFGLDVIQFNDTRERVQTHTSLGSNSCGKAERYISCNFLIVFQFVGTTVALGIPLIYLARQRTTTVRTALKGSSAAPPRRTGGSPAQLGRKTGNVSSGPVSNAASSTVEHSSPGTSELLSAISRVDFSTAIYAGKAFGIATGIVTISAVALTIGVKSYMGVQDVRGYISVLL
jgi:hypothetical protein